MNSALLSPKSSKCLIGIIVEPSFSRILGFVCGSGTIKTGRVLFEQVKHLQTIGYGTDWLKAYKNFVQHTEQSRRKGLHETNRIIKLQTASLLGEAPSQYPLLKQIENNVGSFFENTHP